MVISACIHVVIIRSDSKSQSPDFINIHNSRAFEHWNMQTAVYYNT